jgi:hypothetical protein
VVKRELGLGSWIPPEINQNRYYQGMKRHTKLLLIAVILFFITAGVWLNRRPGGWLRPPPAVVAIVRDTPPAPQPAQPEVRQKVPPAPVPHSKEFKRAMNLRMLDYRLRQEWNQLEVTNQNAPTPVWLAATRGFELKNLKFLTDLKNAGWASWYQFRNRPAGVVHDNYVPDQQETSRQQALLAEIEKLKIESKEMESAPDPAAALAQWQQKNQQRLHHLQSNAVRLRLDFPPELTAARTPRK